MADIKVTAFLDISILLLRWLPGVATVTVGAALAETSWETWDWVWLLGAWKSKGRHERRPVHFGLMTLWLRSWLPAFLELEKGGPI